MSDEQRNEIKMNELWTRKILRIVKIKVVIFPIITSTRFLKSTDTVDRRDRYNFIYLL